MKLSTRDQDQASVFHIKGDLTGDHCERLRAEAEQAFRRGVRDLVLDLQETGFIDSHGLESLLWLQDRGAESLGQVRLAAPSDDVRTILRVTRLASRVEAHDSVDDALKSLRI